MDGHASEKAGSFWEHLEELRSSLGRIILAVMALGVVAFFFKEELFSVILAPRSSDFVSYGLWEQAARMLSLSENGLDTFSVKLINTQLAQQFVIHVKAALYTAFLLVFPYILYELFRFVSPALYDHERRYAFRIVGSGYLMFMLGVALSYFLVFPLTFRFLGTYQVSNDVENQITLESYMETLLMLNLTMGLLFELPVLSWLFAKWGFISAAFLRKYRRHAIVILLIVASIITPTADIVTLLLVALPIYILYELSILIVATTQKR